MYMNTTLTDNNTFYVATDDGDHMNMCDTNLSIFEALCSYHQAINEGDEGYILELELGTWDSDDEDCEIEPILFHEFWELLLLTSKELHIHRGSFFSLSLLSTGLFLRIVSMNHTPTN